MKPSIWKSILVKERVASVAPSVGGFAVVRGAHDVQHESEWLDVDLDLQPVPELPVEPELQLQL